MSGVLAFIKKNFLLLLLLGLGTVSFLRTCSNDKNISKAIEKLKTADSLLTSAKVVLDSADKKLGRAGDDVSSALGMLGHADSSLNDLTELNVNSLRNIRNSLNNVKSIDQGKKQNQEKYQKQIDSMDLEIKKLLKEIKNGKN